MILRSSRVLICERWTDKELSRRLELLPRDCLVRIGAVVEERLNHAVITSFKKIEMRIIEGE